MKNWSVFGLVLATLAASTQFGERYGFPNKWYMKPILCSAGAGHRVRASTTSASTVRPRSTPWPRIIRLGPGPEEDVSVVERWIQHRDDRDRAGRAQWSTVLKLQGIDDWPSAGPLGAIARGDNAAIMAIGVRAVYDGPLVLFGALRSFSESSS